MFEKFTDQARRVVVLAQEEARMLNHAYIGTEHLLLGLSSEGTSVAAQALEALNVDLGAIRQQVTAIIGPGSRAPSGHIPFTPRAKKVLELSNREAIQLGHDAIGPEHLLLAVVREGQGVAADVLARLGADLTLVRGQVIERLGDKVRGPVPGMFGKGSQRGKRKGDQLIAGAFARIGSLEDRLTAMETWVGSRPSPDELNRQIADVRRDKEAAIDRQDFDTAAALRDKEKRLLDSKASAGKEQADAAGSGQSMAEEIGQLRAEVERMRAALREHGIDPQDGVS